MPERGESQRRAWLTMKYGKIDVTGLIVDYVEESRFEGRIIRDTWNNMGWKAILSDKPRGNWKAIDALMNIGPGCNVIHISAHGNPHGIGRSQQGNEGTRPREIWWSFKDERIEKLEKVTLVVNSSCNTYSNSWSNLFIKKLGVECYVGPRRSPSFYEGIVFPLAFYLNMWDRVLDDKELTRQTVVKAFKEAIKSLNTQAKWTLRTRDRKEIEG